MNAIKNSFLALPEAEKVLEVLDEIVNIN